MKPGDKIKFEEERLRYTVQSVSSRFAVCTRNYRGKKHAGCKVYVLIDFENQVRGPDYWIFGKYDYKTRKSCQQVLQELESGECELSRRMSIPLNIESVSEYVK